MKGLIEVPKVEYKIDTEYWKVGDPVTLYHEVNEILEDKCNGLVLHVKEESISVVYVNPTEEDYHVCSFDAEGIRSYRVEKLNVSRETSAQASAKAETTKAKPLPEGIALVQVPKFEYDYWKVGDSVTVIKKGIGIITGTIDRFGMNYHSMYVKHDGDEFNREQVDADVVLSGYTTVTKVDTV